MKFEQVANKLFTNTYFLYAMVFFSALSILGYLLANNFDAIVFFALVGVISVNFSRNMAIVLTICLLSTNLLLANKIYEGMTGNTTTTTTTGKTTEEPASTTEPTTTTTTTMTDEEKMKKMMMAKKLQETKSASSTTDSTVIGAEGTDEPFGSMNRDARLDHAATIKQAYGELNAILDPEAIKNLSLETMDLMKEQKKLMASMSSMQPLMAQAQELVQGFKSGGFASAASNAMGK
jgi:hypothetical protein